MKRTEQRRIQASPTPEMQMDRTRVVVLQHSTKGCGEMRAAKKNKHWTWSINHISDAVLLMEPTGALKKVTLLLIECIKEDAFGRTVCNNTSLSSLFFFIFEPPASTCFKYMLSAGFIPVGSVLWSHISWAQFKAPFEVCRWIWLLLLLAVMWLRVQRVWTETPVIHV